MIVSLICNLILLKYFTITHSKELVDIYKVSSIFNGILLGRAKVVSFDAQVDLHMVALMGHLQQFGNDSS